jgi:1-acyl-sn-glycerol-3-phosphate acyltransferase
MTGTPASAPVLGDGVSAHHDAPLALLTPLERRWYGIADALYRRWPWVSIRWNELFMVNVVRLIAMRRIHVTGLEHLPGPEARVILVANHRSFFDFFATGAILYARSRMPRSVMFPVRTQFFYDSWGGGVMNGIMAGFTMFPPIVRESERAAFNRFAIARCAEFLAEPGRCVGMHPEGKRGHSADPYEMLPVQPGVGRIVLASPGVVVIPVWIWGLTNRASREACDNWLRPGSHPIDIDFGPPIPLDDLIAAADPGPIAARCQDAIRELAECQRNRRTTPMC